MTVRGSDRPSTIRSNRHQCEFAKQAPVRISQQERSRCMRKEGCYGDSKRIGVSHDRLEVSDVDANALAFFNLKLFEVLQINRNRSL